MVAVAAAAKQRDHAAAGKVAHGLEDVFQRVGRMRIIQDHLVGRIGIQHFGAARHGAHAFQPLDDIIQRYP